MSFWDTVLAAAGALDQRSYYELLSVPSDAHGDVIVARFYELTSKLHPDRHARERDPRRKDALTRVYARLNEAVQVLSVPALRSSYDDALAAGRTRLDPEDATANTGPRETRDPKTEAGRKMLARGLAMLDGKDLRGARAQLQLALQMEPDSRAIARALGRVDEADPRKKMAPKTTHAAAQVAPSAAPTDPAPPGPAPAAPPPSPTAAASAPPRSTAPPPTEPPRRRRRSSRTELARAHTRYPMARPVRLRLAGWTKFETLYTQDISRGGLYLATPKPLPAGQPVTLTLELPDGQSVELDAVVVRTVRPGEGPTPGMGLRFSEMTERLQAQLRSLVRQHARAAEAAPIPAADAAPSLELVVAELARVQTSGPRPAFGLGADATLEDLRVAYETRVARFHPSLFEAADQPRAREAAMELLVCLRRAAEQLRSEISAPCIGPDDDEFRPEDSGVRLVDPSVRTSAARPAEHDVRPRKLLDGELYDDHALTPIERVARRARELIERGEFSRARSELESALAGAPREPRLLAGYFLAAGYAAKAEGNATQARRYFRQVLLYDEQCAEAIAELRTR